VTLQTRPIGDSSFGQQVAVLAGDALPAVRMADKWVGFGRDMTVNTGLWSLT
jgi:hypothetical protein